MRTEQDCQEILDCLQRIYPGAQTALRFQTPFQLLVATVLSAQATDRSVNQVTPALFAAYPTPQRMQLATPQQLEELIRTIGLYRSKAKYLVGLAEQLCTRFGGEVPHSFAELRSLPGVGHKTAKVVLANWTGEPAIAVDTHVGRLARRLGLSAELRPDRVELELEAQFPQESWIYLHHALIQHGRAVCRARQPRCASCALHRLCPRLGL